MDRLWGTAMIRRIKHVWALIFYRFACSAVRSWFLCHFQGQIVRLADFTSSYKCFGKRNENNEEKHLLFEMNIWKTKNICWGYSYLLWVIRYSIALSISVFFFLLQTNNNNNITEIMKFGMIQVSIWFVNAFFFPLENNRERFLWHRNHIHIHTYTYIYIYRILYTYILCNVIFHTLILLAKIIKYEEKMWWDKKLWCSQWVWQR